MSQDSHRILFGGTVIDISDPDLRERIRVKPEWEKFQEIVSSLEDIVIGGKSVLNALQFLIVTWSSSSLSSTTTYGDI